MKKLLNNFSVSAVAIVVMTVCSCSSDNKTLPKIDGYNNSGEVATANLVANWTFDDTYNEAKSGTAPANQYGTVGFNTGQIGKALQLTQGAMVYPPIAAINTATALPSYTVSMWVNMKNTGAGFTTLFGIFPTANTDFWGNLSGGAETSWFPPRTDPDTLVLKANYMSLNGDLSLNGQDNRPDPRGKPPVGVFMGAGKWSHFVFRFTASTHMLEIFGDGNSIGAYNNRGDNTVALNMRVPCQAVFGSLATSEIGFTTAPVRPDWQVLATATIDDVRVYNTPLANNEITALFNLGTAGR